MTLRRALILSVLSVGMLVISCSQQAPSAAAENLYGYVEGHVTRNGAPVAGVLVSAIPSTLGTGSVLAKQQSSATSATAAASNPDDTLGYYRVALLEGTYTIMYYDDQSGYSMQIQRIVRVVRDSTTQLDVELAAQQLELDVSVSGLIVQLSWDDVAVSYVVERSTDAITWSQLPENGVLNPYTTISSYYSDAVLDYGVYTYRVRGLDVDNSVMVTSFEVAVTVENRPPALSNVRVADSISFLWATATTSLSQYQGECRAIVLRAPALTRVFDRIDTLDLQAAPSSSTTFLFEYRDTDLDTGSYAFAFFLIDNTTHVAGDTTTPLIVHYTQKLPAPTCTIVDSLFFVQVRGQTSSYLQAGDALVFFRSKDDSTHMAVLDTIRALSSNTTYVTYKDFSVESGVPYYYAVQQIRHDGVYGQRSRAVRVVHSSKIPAPTLSNAADSGLYVRLDIYDNQYAQFPVIVFRATLTDTATVDTISISGSYQTTIFRDFPPREGRYSYAVAHVGIDDKPGKVSTWRTVMFTNKKIGPTAPSVSLSSTGLVVDVYFATVTGVARYYVRRGFQSQDSMRTVDTIPAFSYSNHFYDSLAVRGLYFYSVIAVGSDGTESPEIVQTVYHAAMVPAPTSPTLAAYPTYVSVYCYLSSSPGDSVVIYRSKNPQSGYVAVASRYVGGSSSLYYYDTLSSAGPGTYYYQIATKTRNVASANSAPAAIYFSGLLTTPGSLVAKADSHAVRLSIPSYSYTYDSTIVYRSTSATGTYVRVVARPAGYVGFVYDSLTSTGTYYYRSSVVKGVLSSDFSVAVAVAFPGRDNLGVVISPARGAMWTVGSYVSVVWNYSAIPSSYVNIQLYRNGTPSQMLYSGTYNDGEHSVTLSSFVLPDTTYQVVLTDYSTGAVVGQSAVFTIN